jgi:hypothetical protein
VSLGTPAIVNGIIVDDYLVNGWPHNFSKCWMGIYKKGIFTTAYLVKDDANKEGSVVKILSAPEDYIASITWDFVYCLRGMYTREDQRNLGIGYLMGVWARTWVAVNEGKKINAPVTGNRVNQVAEFLKKFKETYGDAEISL